MRGLVCLPTMPGPCPSPRTRRFLHTVLLLLCVCGTHSLPTTTPLESCSTSSHQRSSRWFSSTSKRKTQRRIRKAFRLVARGGGSTAIKTESVELVKATPSSSSTDTKTRVSALLDGLRSGAASGMAAMCVKTLLQPLDAIKTLQQFQQTTATDAQALSTVAAARILLQRPGGIANLYAGLGVTVFGSIPGVAIYFGIYQFCKQKLLQETTWGPKYPKVSIALSAAFGNTIASMSRTPYEVLKQKLQMGAYPTFGAAVRAVLAHPMESLFPKGGVLIQMIRDVPYAVVTLLVYETLQGVLANAEGEQKDGSSRKKHWDFLIGGFAGGVGGWVTNPLDVLKTRLQTDSANVYGGSVTKCASMVWNEGGAPAFLRGSVPRLIHKVPANCFFFLFYEMFRRFLHAQPVASKEEEDGPRKQT